MLSCPIKSLLVLIRPVTDISGLIYVPSQNEPIDQSMIRFKGRSALKQYIPQKPIKQSYKVWLHADESSYVCQFQVYTGTVGVSVEKDLGKRVVTDLTCTLVGRSSCIFIPFFNLVELQKQLQSELIYACGTVRKGRKNLPINLKEDSKMKRTESEWWISLDGLSFLKWKDRKAVHFLSNYLDFAKRIERDNSKQEISCSKLVCQCNKRMGYVDTFDMYKAKYGIDYKSQKWWHRIFWYFSDMIVVNAFIIFKKGSVSSANIRSLKDFKMAVALGLVGAEKDTTKSDRHRLLKLQFRIKLGTVPVVVCPFIAFPQDVLFAVPGLVRIELDGCVQGT
ncbi:hypothetical protein ILUMI_11283 [Ignelater luminosus]|uniref:PiggyBac transposable element-derived protein domain-containing protein n=1 Tax=Ignelater luminosus TaxID=2038154 RepID=A0A8K0CYQ7_IGNLU|nr:hypothetical protein ILUMI_11283 [Ignelater luminosus]